MLLFELFTFFHIREEGIRSCLVEINVAHDLAERHCGVRTERKLAFASEGEQNANEQFKKLVFRSLFVLNCKLFTNIILQAIAPLPASEGRREAAAPCVAAPVEGMAAKLGLCVLKS